MTEKSIKGVIGDENIYSSEIVISDERIYSLVKNNKNLSNIVLKIDSNEDVNETPRSKLRGIFLCDA